MLLVLRYSLLTPVPSDPQEHDVSNGALEGGLRTQQKATTLEPSIYFEVWEALGFKKKRRLCTPITVVERFSAVDEARSIVAVSTRDVLNAVVFKLLVFPLYTLLCIVFGCSLQGLGVICLLSKIAILLLDCSTCFFFLGRDVTESRLWFSTDPAALLCESTPFLNRRFTIFTQSLNDALPSSQQ